jgi:hypothetical protein
MMVVLLIAGIGFLLAGLLVIGVGIQVDLSFGNTLILAGAVVACTGMILLGLWTVVRELKNIARWLGDGVATEFDAEIALESTAAGLTPRTQARRNAGFLFGRDRPPPESAGHVEPAEQFAPSAAPWHDEVAPRDRGRRDAPSVPEPVEGAPPLKRRNLLFSSSRKERERAQARTTDASDDFVPPSPAASPASKSREVPPPTFEDTWPKPERARTADVPPQRRGGRAPSTFTEAGEAAADSNPPAAPDQGQPPVTVLKSGVVDGMAYSLYSDGSIEAQMPEGMMRFASIDELRAHLDHRP